MMSEPLAASAHPTTQRTTLELVAYVDVDVDLGIGRGWVYLFKCLLPVIVSGSWYRGHRMGGGTIWPARVGSRLSSTINDHPPSESVVQVLRPKHGGHVRA